MKKLLLLASCVATLTLIWVGLAPAADMPVKSTPRQIMAEPAINWTGGYVGVLVGYGQKTDDMLISGNDKFSNFIMAHNLFPSTIGLRPDGFTLGGKVGYDYQFAPKFVVGAMVDWSYSNINATSFAGGNLVGVSYSEKISNIGDILGRVGYLVGDANRVLVYVAGGGTWATVKNTVTSAGLIPAFGAAPTGNSSDTKWGWSIGGGLEYKLDRAWSVDLSYLYSDLGTATTLVSMPIGKSTTTFTNTEAVKLQRVMLGINYKFN